MRIRTILAVLGFLAVAMPAMAQVSTPINSQGTSGAPVSVGASATAVLLGNRARQHWAIYSETVDIRCTLGTSAGTGTSSAGKGTPTPTSSVGFLLHTGILYTEQSFQLGSATVTRELDCILATGSTATNVDTWEE